jgi:hypothetical protein
MSAFARSTSGGGGARLGEDGNDDGTTLKNAGDMFVEEVDDIIDDIDDVTVRDSEISPIEDGSEEGAAEDTPNGHSERVVSPEKNELVNSVLMLQETLVDISTKVKVVEQENADSRKEIDVLKVYVDNMMAKITAVKNVSSEL